jgi:hypothetical protein
MLYALGDNAGGGAAAPQHYEFVAETVVAGGAVTTVTFAGLDINTHQQYILFFNIDYVGAGGAQFYMYVENDLVNANYYTENCRAIGAVTTAERSNDPRIGTCDNASKCVGQVTVFRDVEGRYRTLSHLAQNHGNNLLILFYSIAKEGLVANITRLDIVSSGANGIGNGSYFRLYRVTS